MMTQLLITAVAGGVGAAARYIVDTLVSRLRCRSFPAGTAVVNVSASIAVGLIAGLGSALPTPLSWVLSVGLVGGYGTFSTASVETARLLEQKRLGAAVLHSVGVLAFSVAVAAIGAGVGALAVRGS